MGIKEDETKWEVYICYPKRKEWLLLGKYNQYKLAKERYKEFSNKSECMMRIVRAELHRTIILEDLRGHIDEKI